MLRLFLITDADQRIGGEFSMARYTGPKCRLCRREGVKLFLKGARCESEKCALTRRAQAPGQHGTQRKRKASGYAIQLREKQKAKRIYGILEKQFSNYVSKAVKEKKVTGEALMQMLEARLDSIVYRGGFCASRAQARQFIRFGYYLVNGKTVTTPSYLVNEGDVVTIAKPEKIAVREAIKFPEWLSYSKDEGKLQVLSLPTLAQLEAQNYDVNPQLIVEFYSR